LIKLDVLEAYFPTGDLDCSTVRIHESNSYCELIVLIIKVGLYKVLKLANFDLGVMGHLRPALGTEGDGRGH